MESQQRQPAHAFVAQTIIAVACVVGSLGCGMPAFAVEDVAKPDSKTDTKADSKASTKADATADNKTEAKSDSKPEAKSDSKPDAKTADASLPEVLPPSQFFGKAQMGYAAARLCPEIIVKLFCYCGCDFTDDHHNLLDCFATDHGADCHICQEAAILALKMKRDEKPIAEIQKAVDQKWEKEYPFMEPSPALKKYRATRLWKPAGATKNTGETSTSQQTKQPGKAAAKSTSTGSNSPKVKPGAKGSCCGGKK